MSLVQNFPFFAIMLCMIAGIITSILKPRAARLLTFTALGMVVVLNAFTLNLTLGLDKAYPFMMGHFPSPWGNEIRIGSLEALMATGFSAVIFISLLAGHSRLPAMVTNKKLNL